MNLPTPTPHAQPPPDWSWAVEVVTTVSGDIVAIVAPRRSPSWESLGRAPECDRWFNPVPQHRLRTRWTSTMKIAAAQDGNGDDCWKAGWVWLVAL